MSSPKKLTLFLFCFTSSLSLGFADTILLKSGGTLTGDVIISEPDKVVIDYFVTPTIRDEKTVSRDDIARMTLVPKDEKSYAALGNRKAPPTVMDTAFYDALIEKKIPEFIQKYPYSPHLEELRHDLVALTEERSRVIRGDRKISGAWLTAEQIADDPYQTTAKIKLNEIMEVGENDEPVSALKKYELMEKDYSGAVAFPDAVDIALALMNKLQNRLSSTIANFAILDKQRRLTLESGQVEEAREIRDALVIENSEAQADMAKATADGTKFFPIFPNIKVALEALQALIVSEKARLELLQKIPMRESIAASSEAARLLKEGDLKGAQNQLDSASKLWPGNAEIATITPKIESATKLAQAEAAAAKAAQALAEAAAKAKPTPSHAKKP